jgi:hypothetical protein
MQDIKQTLESEDQVQIKSNGTSISGRTRTNNLTFSGEGCLDGSENVPLRRKVTAREAEKRSEETRTISSDPGRE